MERKTQEKLEDIIRISQVVGEKLIIVGDSQVLVTVEVFHGLDVKVGHPTIKGLT